jgi:uroporphyrinogen-III synthase
VTGVANTLTGRRILLTRTEEDCAEWAARIAQVGAEPVLLPCIRCEPIDTPELRSELRAAAHEANWLIFTSARGVAAFTALQDARPNDRLTKRNRVAVVGFATAEAARAALGRVDWIGGGTAASLADALVGQTQIAADSRVLIAVAENAGDILQRTLQAAGASCARFDVYRTLPAPPRVRKRALSTLGADTIVLASPSAVTGFVHQVHVDTQCAIYTIGPSTTAAARAQGLSVTAEAREPSLEGVLEAMQWRN